MRVRVLGSAAGGGFPQWNCGCPNCPGGPGRVDSGGPPGAGKRRGQRRWQGGGSSSTPRPKSAPRSRVFPALHPRGPRDWPIAAVLLTNGDLDHCLGLLSLRESHPVTVYATDRVRRGFSEGNVLYRTLERFAGQVTWQPLVPGREVELAGPGGTPSGLFGPCGGAAWEASGPSRWSAFRPDPEDNVGFRILERATGRVLAYFSGVAAVTPAVLDALPGRGLRVPRRHVLVGRRADRGSVSATSGRGGHGPSADRRAGGQPGCARRLPIGSADLRPQSTTPIRSCARTRRSGRWWRKEPSRVDSGARRHGARAVSDASANSARGPLRPRGVDGIGCGAKAQTAPTDHHRYHVLMHAGTLTKLQLQQWVLNRGPGGPRA